MTDVTDDFNRANGALGANWTDITGGADTLQISSNKVVATTNHCVAYWSANTFSNDHYSQCVVGPANVKYCGLTVRQQVGAHSNYVMYVDIAAGSTLIYRVDAGSFTQLGATISTAWASGDTAKLDATGTTLTALRNGSSIGTRTDATYASGYPGMDMIANTNTPTNDDWLGGPITVTTTVGLTAGLVGGRLLEGIT